jgi:glycosyltransferase involved in cell wall biosynthesis
VTTRRRLAVVEYLMSAGGVERVLRGLARAFLDIPEARDWEITFLLSRYTSARHLAEWPAALTGPNLRVEWLGQHTAASRALDPLFHLQGVGGVKATRIPAWAFAAAARRLGPEAWRAWLGDRAALISQASRRFDLLYFPYPFLMPAPPMAAPVVATPQDFNFKFFVPEGSIRRRLEERAVRSWLDRADRVLVTSRAVEGELQRFYPEHAAKTGVVHLGIDAARPAPSPEELCAVRTARGLPERFVLVSGWIVPHKNQKLVIEAIARLRARGEAIPLVFVGPNTGHLAGGPAPGFRTPYVEAVCASLAAAGLEHGRDFHALGYVSDNEIHALLHLATVYVCPSTYEGFGLPGLEAMRARCPVLLSRIPPLEEQNRLLGGSIRTFDPADAEELASQLQAVLSSPAEAASTAAALAPRVGDVYDWRKTARAYLAEFERLLAARPEGAASDSGT